MKSVFKYISKRILYRLAFGLVMLVLMYLESNLMAEEASYVSNGIRLTCEPTGFFTNGGPTTYKWVGSNEASTDGDWCASQMSEPSVYSNFRTYTYQGAPQTESNTIPISEEFSYSPLFSHYFHTGLYPDEHTDKIVANLASVAFSYYECPDGEQSASPFTCAIQPSCADQDAPFISQTPQEELCVTNPNNGLACGYFTELGQYGNFTGVFAPTGSACECSWMPGGTCETLVEPDLPEGEDCTIFGTQRWCSSDPSQCNGGSLDSCSNCGTVNGTFMCSDGAAPDGEYCYSGSGRSECEGVPDGYCPTGYVCNPLDKEQPDTGDTDDIDQPLCTTGDTREECQGVPDGNKPIKSEETSQLEFANKQLDAINDKLNQSNKNSKDGNIQREEGNGLLKNIRDTLDDLNNDDDASVKRTEYEAKEAASVLSAESLFNDRSYESSLSTGEQGIFASITNSIGGKIVPTAACTDIALTIPTTSTIMNIPLCSIAGYVRPILAWIFMLVGYIYIKREIVKAFKGLV